MATTTATTTTTTTTTTAPTHYTGACPYQDDKDTQISIKPALAHGHNVIGCVNCKRMSIIASVDDTNHTMQLSAAE